MALMALKKAAGTVALPLATAVAEGGSSTGFDVTSIMTESVNTVQSQIFSTLGIVVPAIVVVTGAVVGITFGIKWLKKLKSA